MTESVDDLLERIRNADPVEELRLWSAFVDRVTLTFPFPVDVVVTQHEDGKRVVMRIDMHVPERDTREPIVVTTRQVCLPWVDDKTALDTLFEVIGIALVHETHESVRLDGKLARELHLRR